MILLLALSIALAQPPRTSSPEYVVGPLDRLSVTVFGEPELTRTVTVEADGSFDFPLIGRVAAAGQTLRAIQQELTRRLGPPDGYLVRPQVTLHVETYRSQIVYVIGHVRNPGSVPLMGNMTVMEALSRAGSPTPDAGPYILISRRAPGETVAGPVLPGEGATPVAAERVSMADLQSGRAQDIVLGDGDTIFVPKADAFYVNGHVRSPGAYVLDGEVTVQKAIGMAGGITERGAAGRIRITRMVDGRQVTLRNVKLSDLVMPGDILDVPQRFF